MLGRRDHEGSMCTYHYHYCMYTIYNILMMYKVGWLHCAKFCFFFPESTTSMGAAMLSKHQWISALHYTVTTFRDITLTFCVWVKPEEGALNFLCLYSWWKKRSEKVLYRERSLSTVETVTSKKRLSAVKFLEGLFEYQIATSRIFSLEKGLFYVVGSVVILWITQPEPPV